MDKEKIAKIVASVLDKLRQSDLHQDLLKNLLKETNPIEVEKTVKDFIDENKIEDKQDRQNLFAFLKDEGLFKKHTKIEGLHNIWIKLRNEYAPHFFLEN